MTAADQTDPTMASSQRLFKVMWAAEGGNDCAARLGRLSLPGRKAIDTPNYTGFASRGTIPHLTPDVLSKHSSLSSAYMALEDFLDKKDPPILKTPAHDALHAFTSFPRHVSTIMGARRVPAVVPPAGNTDKNIGIYTSTGFASITVAKYASAIEKLHPDIVIPLAEMLHTSSNPVFKKQLRMAERTEGWVDEFLGLLDMTVTDVSVFAPIPPVEHPIQWSYLNHLSEDLAEKLSGLAIYDVNMLPELAAYKPLAQLPRLSLDIPQSPRAILRQILLGVDMVMVPFVNGTSDAGIALTFTLRPPKSDATACRQVLPLGVDMWSDEHRTSLAPLAEGCRCHTCQRHHRAYVHHLLNAREMLGWNLLQIHNHHVVDEFLKAIRETLRSGGGAGTGTSELEAASRRFEASYEPELPEGTGQRPRARGYHFKSQAGQERYNKPSWQGLGGVEPGQQVSETPPPVPEGSGQTLAEKGFAQKEASSR
ncbi:queuine tRNA-ribosyltransferase [Geosmithia morbida]|uniref:Queuine tRNA-ribosyltransferase accessory subunit 2 n=1 Tax=Geosmithia morbida TaxID=1094350 RepID=A0A9P4YPB3_9HYPO|nr:queuine tRNA-ribosyltransferase [Geosmithia morbida]KAF4120225.1 queuine tRNA-ribosyltransferase [Geosmithia morbida]